MDDVKCFDATGAPLKYLYQWDTNQSIKILAKIDASVNMEVHFCNVGSDEALVVSPSVAEEYVVADVPNILLQQAKSIMVYLVQNPDSATARTIVASRITVVPRPRPDDYVYTESEVLNYRTIEARLVAVEEQLETTVDADAIKESVKEYFEENPVDVPTTLPNPQKITFSGAVEGEYNGSVETNIVIPTPPVIPETLPSPHPITFTGTITGSYDGSAPMTVHIPEGGSGGAGVYVGSEEPTDENIDLWVDTDEEEGVSSEGGGNSVSEYPDTPQFDFIVEEDCASILLDTLNDIPLSDYNFSTMYLIVNNAAVDTAVSGALQVRNNYTWGAITHPIASVNNFIRQTIPRWWSVYFNHKEKINYWQTTATSRNIDASTRTGQTYPYDNKAASVVLPITNVYINATEACQIPAGTRIIVWLK